MTTEEILKEYGERITALEKYIIQDGKTSKGKEITCEYCDYIWNTTSKMEKTSCPNCGRKVIIDKSKLPENYDMIKLHFSKGKKCPRCKELIKSSKEARYIPPQIYCKNCFDKINEADRREIDRGLKEIL